MTAVKSVESGLGIDASENIGDVNNIIMAQEVDVKLVGTWSTVVAILKTMIGVGILGLPYAIKSGGWLFSIFVFPVIAVLTGYCMVALIKAKEAAHLSRTSNPADVGEVGYGAVGRIVVAVIVCLNSFGICLSYYIFITYNMFLLTGLRQEIWAAIFFFFFLIVSYIRPVAYISYMTIVANSLTLIGVIVTLIAVFVAAKPQGEPHMFNWADFPLFIGVVLFAFQAVNIAIPAHNTLRDQGRFTVATIIVMIVGCVAYLSFGLIVYLRLADNSLSMITDAIDVFGVQIAVAVLFIVSLCVNMICWIYPIYEISDRLSCANKFYIMSKSERARILALNEGQAEVPANSSPTPTYSGSHVVITPNPNSTPSSTMPPPYSNNLNSGDSFKEKEELEVKVEENTRSSSFVQSDPADGPVWTELEPAPAVTVTAAAIGVGSSSSSAVSPSTHTAEEELEPEMGFLERIWMNWKFWLLSTIGRAVVLLIIMIPSVTPARDHFASFMGLTGCLTGVLMPFLMPMFAQLRIQWKTLPLWQKILDIFIIVVSFPAMIYVTVMTLIDLVKNIQEGSS